MKYAIMRDRPLYDALQQNGAQINSTSVAMTADGGIGAVAENNRIYNTDRGIYHDTYSTKDLLIRNNYFHGVVSGVYESMGRISPANNDVPTRLSYAPPTHNMKIATLITDGVPGTSPKIKLPHGLSVGQAVVIAGASPSAYNGAFQVLSVPDPNTFTYEMLSDPGVDASGETYWGALWQVGRLICEGNIIELVLNLLQNGWGPSVGFDILGAAKVSPYVFNQVILRRNLIRDVDNAVDSTPQLAIRVDSCANAVVEANIIKLNTGTPIIQQPTCGQVKYFNNQTPAGALLQAYLNLGPPSGPQYLNELTLDIGLAADLST